MARFLTIALGTLLGLLILASLGAFFFFVPILPLAAVVTMLLGLILMFVLGVQVGHRRIRIFRRRTISPSRPAGWRSLDGVEKGSTSSSPAPIEPILP